jgi:hypothetical protein
MFHVAGPDGLPGSPSFLFLFRLLGVWLWLPQRVLVIIAPFSEGFRRDTSLLNLQVREWGTDLVHACKLSFLRTSPRFARLSCLHQLSFFFWGGRCWCVHLWWVSCHAEVGAVGLLSDGIDQGMHSDSVSEKKKKKNHSVAVSTLKTPKNRGEIHVKNSVVAKSTSKTPLFFWFQTGVRKRYISLDGLPCTSGSQPEFEADMSCLMGYG